MCGKKLRFISTVGWVHFLSSFKHIERKAIPARLLCSMFTLIKLVRNQTMLVD
jgi:hypothetical protein